ncbi:MAG: DUF4406 domain-containing protein [Shewanella sp.]
MAKISLRKKVYIAGPMSGLPDANRIAFHVAAIAQRDAGHIVLNPATLPAGLDEAEYMQIGLAMLLCCDRIYMLAGWEHSSGALTEYALAKKLDLDIVFQEGDCHEVALNYLQSDAEHHY